MSRAIIMSLEAGTAIVLTPDGRFVRVREKSGYAVGDEVEIDHAEHAARPDRWIRTLVRNRWTISVASAAVIVLALCALWTFRAPTVVAYVTMDVNPSVEMGLDSKERVQELRALNRDAVPIVKAIRYKDEKIEDVTEALAEALAERDLLQAAGSEIVLASVPVRSVKPSWEDDVTSKMRTAIEKAAGPLDGSTAAATRITAVSVPSEVREEAEAHGLSTGKMAFWLKAESQGHDVSLETLRRTSLKDIASSWGGVQAVMDDGAQDGATSKETWKALLKQAQETKPDKLKETKPAGGKPGKGSGQAGGAGKPTAKPTPSPTHPVHAQSTAKPQAGLNGKHGTKDGKKDGREKWRHGWKSEFPGFGDRQRDKSELQRWFDGWSSKELSEYRDRQLEAWAQRDKPDGAGSKTTSAKPSAGDKASGNKNGQKDSNDKKNQNGKTNENGKANQSGKSNNNDKKNQSDKSNNNNKTNQSGKTNKNDKNDSKGNDGKTGAGKSDSGDSSRKQDQKSYRHDGQDSHEERTEKR
ncbi:anti-sigma-I factor RsgI family protein [Cohnella nanjingensis]|uniref:Anti-sigma factor domain-containing protein n=1 Tax=Cohnella nanjingensis TaxID=1387779 RepID=A0A7X0VEQ2_9BACL|nr:anti-sigma factor domain-containing protein [Cohnella nanjingensis]MBB6669789.1 anti-sigma factor domain-containing protein [Cohnella nanjingensis]